MLLYPLWRLGRPLRRPDGALLPLLFRHAACNLLDRQLVLKPVEGIGPHNFLELLVGVLVDEVGHGHEAAAHSHEDLVALFHLDVYPFRAELVDAF